MTCNGQVALEMLIFLYSALFEDLRCLKWASSAWRLDSWEVSAGALLSTERHISFMEISSKCSKRWKHYYTADPIISFNNSTSETSQVWKQRAKTMPRAPSGRDVWGSTADVSKGGEYRFSCSIKFRLRQTKNMLKERALKVPRTTVMTTDAKVFLMRWVLSLSGRKPTEQLIDKQRRWLTDNQIIYQPLHS